MDVGLVAGHAHVQDAAAAAMILLDTNAVIWVVTNHRRARTLRHASRLSISPASVLELAILAHAGRVRLALQDLIEDDRWAVDDPSAADWFLRAGEESWTRDPFDRLIVAHARLRGWRLATGDEQVLAHLRPSEALAL